MVRVVELARGRLVRVRKLDTSDVGGSVFTDLEESCEPLLDSGVLLQRAYWTSGSIWGSRAWRNGEWIRVLFDGGGVIGGVSDIRHVSSDRGRW